MTDPVEWAGFVLSLAMVYCNIKEIHWGWPLAIVSSALYGVVFWNSQLYGEASLQVMFILTALWGWQQWLRGTKVSATVQATTQTSASPLHISALSTLERKRVAIATLLTWPALVFFLDRYTDTDVAIWDGLVTALSLLGQYLLAKKKIENWWVWFLVNCITVGLMVLKSLWLTAGLYVIFAILSVVGFKAWRVEHAQ
jgi:nicotinamide mononucleotide transporter